VNPKKAVKWFRKAAEQGDAESQYELARCYYYGFGINENMKEAEKWYREAAKQGHENAKSVMLAKGWTI